MHGTMAERPVLALLASRPARRQYCAVARRGHGTPPSSPSDRSPRRHLLLPNCRGPSSCRNTRAASVDRSIIEHCLLHAADPGPLEFGRTRVASSSPARARPRLAAAACVTSDRADYVVVQRRVTSDMWLVVSGNERLMDAGRTLREDDEGLPSSSRELSSAAGLGGSGPNCQYGGTVGAWSAAFSQPKKKVGARSRRIVKKAKVAIAKRSKTTTANTTTFNWRRIRQSVPLPLSRSIGALARLQ